MCGEVLTRYKCSHRLKRVEPCTAAHYLKPELGTFVCASVYNDNVYSRTTEWKSEHCCSDRCCEDRRNLKRAEMHEKVRAERQSATTRGVVMDPGVWQAEWSHFESVVDLHRDCMAVRAQGWDSTLKPDYEEDRVRQRGTNSGGITTRETS